MKGFQIEFLEVKGRDGSPKTLLQLNWAEFDSARKNYFGRPAVVFSRTIGLIYIGGACPQCMFKPLSLRDGFKSRKVPLYMR